jgi:hypothetical protein
VLQAAEPSQRECVVWFQAQLSMDRTILPPGLRQQTHQGSPEGFSDIKCDIDYIVDKQIRYLVRWKGYDPDEDEWLNESELSNARATVDAYERSSVAGSSRRKPSRPRRPKSQSTEPSGRRSKRGRLASEPTNSSTSVSDVGRSPRPAGEDLKRPRGPDCSGEAQKRKRRRPARFL